MELALSPADRKVLLAAARDEILAHLGTGGMGAVFAQCLFSLLLVASTLSSSVGPRAARLRANAA